LEHLDRWHDPGQFVWQNSEHGERMQGNRRQAIDALLKQCNTKAKAPSVPAPRAAPSAWRASKHDLDGFEQHQSLITAITHRARNNRGESNPELFNRLGSAAYDSEIPFAQPSDLYRNRLSAIRTSIAGPPKVRPIGGGPTGKSRSPPYDPNTYDKAHDK
jgi:type VI secretion system secreted protein VgrG